MGGRQGFSKVGQRNVTCNQFTDQQFSSCDRLIDVFFVFGCALCSAIAYFINAGVVSLEYPSPFFEPHLWMSLLSRIFLKH